MKKYFIALSIITIISGAGLGAFALAFGPFNFNPQESTKTNDANNNYISENSQDIPWTILFRPVGTKLHRINADEHPRHLPRWIISDAYGALSTTGLNSNFHDNPSDIGFIEGTAEPQIPSSDPLNENQGEFGENPLTLGHIPNMSSSPAGGSNRNSDTQSTTRILDEIDEENAQEHPAPEPATIILGVISFLSLLKSKNRLP